MTEPISKSLVLSSLKVRSLLLWMVGSIILLELFSYGVRHVWQDDSVIDEGYYILLYIIPLVWLLRKFCSHEISLTDLVFYPKKGMPWVKIVLISVLLLVLSMGTYFFLYYALSYVFPTLTEEIINIDDTTEIMQKTSYPLLTYALEVFTTIILAPVIEEIFFRGVLLYRFSHKWGLRTAIVFSSVIFAIFHFDMIGGVFFGIFMSLLYIRYKTLLVPILVHFLNNLVATLLQLWSDSDNQTAMTSTIDDFRSELWLGSVAMAITLPIALYYIFKHWPKDRLDLPIPPPLSQKNNA